jgi:hypothetical protein
VKYRIVKHDELCGRKATIYSVLLEGEEKSLFDDFLERNKEEFEGELLEILKTLRAVGSVTGAKTRFFKAAEGFKIEDQIYALYDKDKVLRLYCRLDGEQVVILGGGGPKTVDRIYKDEVLKKAQETIVKISRDINTRISEEELWFDDFDGSLKGDLNYDNYQD